MSKYLPKPLPIAALGLSAASAIFPSSAHSQTKPAKTVGGVVLSDPNAINKKIKQDYPPELLEDGQPNPSLTQQPGTTNNSVGTSSSNILKSGSDNTTTIGTANYTFVISTPIMIAVAVIIGGLALFPVVSLLLSSKKAAQLGKTSFLAKFSDRFRKPQILESDKFLHHRTVEKLAQITNQAENLNADKFGNTEFMVFFKIKSYIARSLDEYANLDEVIELLKIAIEAQNSFSQIDSTESRYCSSSQQNLYKFVNTLLPQDLPPAEFKDLVEQKLSELLPSLKTEEGKLALQAYIIEVCKISEHVLGRKLILSFKKYQLTDYSTLRSVSNTIALLESEDLLNLDALMLLVMVKYDVFEKLGPIVGIDEQYNRPETYSKMLQYIGLKSRHESSYQKFQEFLLLLKQWEIHYQSVVNVRAKYSEKEYRLPKEFHDEVPGLKIYQKYKDSFHLITQVKPVVAPTEESFAVVPTVTVMPEAEDSTAVVPTLHVMPEVEDSTAVVPMLIVVPEVEDSTAVVPMLTVVPEAQDSEAVVPTVTVVPEVEDSTTAAPTLTTVN